MKGLWLVARYLAAIAGVVILQLVPATGVFLMMFMAMFWSAALFNLMLLHVGFRAATGAIERAWLAFPLAVYAGWATLGGISYLQARDLQAAMNAANEGVKRPASGTTAFVVTSQDARLADETAASFAKVFKNARVYGSGRRFERAFDTRCQSKANAEWKVDAEIPTVDTSYTLPAVRYGGWCLVSKAESPPPDGVLVDARRLTDPSLLVRLESGRALALSQRMVVGGTQGLGEIRQGTISYLSPLPHFLAGCALLSSGPSWECSWQVGRNVLTVGQSSKYGRHHEDMDRATFVAQRLGVPHY